METLAEAKQSEIRILKPTIEDTCHHFFYSFTQYQALFEDTYSLFLNFLFCPTLSSEGPHASGSMQLNPMNTLEQSV